VVPIVLAAWITRPANCPFGEVVVARKVERLQKLPIAPSRNVT
jgi:hypothetical protein